MATTKQAEREQTDALLADEYLSDLVYDALLQRGEASKVSEITLEINNPRVTFPVVRRAVADSTRFLTIDRMWDLSARYLDRSRPTERTLAEILEAAGKPLTTAEMATELSIVYARPTEVYTQLLARILRNENTYVKTLSGAWGLTTWLPLVDGEDEADVLADNNLSPEKVSPYRKAAQSAKWATASYADATVAMVEAMGDRPVPHKTLGVLAFLTIGEKYDPAKHLQACLADPRLVWLSGRGGGRWITRAHADRLEAQLDARGVALSGEDTSEEVAAPVVVAPPVVPDAAPAPDEAPVEAAPLVVEAAPPLDITDADMASLERIIADRGMPVDATELLATQYEVVAGDPSYRSDIETLETRLKNSDKFLYVGAGRFREPNSLPLFVYEIPEYLSFPELQFVSLDGEIMDEEIEDEGLIGTLRQDLLLPLAQDAGDDEGRYTGADPADPSTVRLVVKAHHKDIGTFPLCQIPDGFLPTDAPVVEITVRAPNGESHDIVVNHEKRLAFNFFGLYEFLPVDSGAVFHLHRTARPYEFRFEPTEETDAQVGVAPARLGELQALKEQAESSEELATFDITCEVLAHYPKGLDFVQLFTEVNIVRRITRRKLASILSNYYCFMQKAGQPLWRFDARKRDLGTDRDKRKYIKR